MILPKHELKHFSYFIETHKFGQDKNYRDTCHDIIKIYYSQPKSFLNFKYRKEWSREYKILRRRTADGKWGQADSARTLLEQLHKVEQSNWTFVEPIVYNKLCTLHPELFL